MGINHRGKREQRVRRRDPNGRKENGECGLAAVERGITTTVFRSLFNVSCVSTTQGLAA